MLRAALGRATRLRGSGNVVPASTRIGTGSTWATVSVGAGHICATRTGHTLWCWGRNDAGQLGNGTTTERYSPIKIGTAAWFSVSTGKPRDLTESAGNTCGIRTDHTLWCWGGNYAGQLGTGTARNT